MVPALDPYDALAALEFQIAMGADEAIGEVPQDRYAQSAAAAEQAPASRPGRTAPPPQAEVDPIAEARRAWSAASGSRTRG